MAAANNATQNLIKDKIQRLTKYVETMKNRLTNIPARHANKDVYLAWVNREIQVAQSTIDKLKM